MQLKPKHAVNEALHVNDAQTCQRGAVAPGVTGAAALGASPGKCATVATSLCLAGGVGLCMGAPLCCQQPAALITKRWDSAFVCCLSVNYVFDMATSLTLMSQRKITFVLSQAMELHP